MSGHLLNLPAETRVIGVMSGTSLDGVDVAIARISGPGTAPSVSLDSFSTTPYPPALRTLLKQAAESTTFSVSTLSQLNVRVAHEYARCIRRTMAEAGIHSVDLIGSHGQTVRHLPDAEDCAGMAVASTMQVGDPSVLANLLHVPVVGDFRLADMALGGQGAPLVPFYDYVALGHETQTRGLLNVGGIANLTVLPAKSQRGAVCGFDTGCGNMVLDALAEKLLGTPFDRDGDVARSGTPSEKVLHQLLQQEYFQRQPPKSTGRERFGAHYVHQFLAMCDKLPPNDVMATATALTARSVYQAYESFVRREHPLDVLIVSGGGRHNAALMHMLSTCFAPIPVVPLDLYGIESDAKEALCFAVLAHETVRGRPTSMIGATGASRPTILGKICVPG